MISCPHHFHSATARRRHVGRTAGSHNQHTGPVAHAPGPRGVIHMKRKWIFAAVGFVALALAVIAGCSKPGGQDAESKDNKTAKDKSDGEHAHKPGQHAGTIVEIGRDNYHAEAVFAENGLVRLYVLAKDEAQIQEV